MKVCAIVPTYDNPATVRDVVLGIRRHLETVIVVDDGSGPEGRDVVRALARDGLATTVRRARNGGKGAAVKTGLDTAHRLGFSHAVQLDADNQHDPDEIPKLLEAARREPDALVLGVPVFDESAPRSRIVGRKISIVWAHIEVGRPAIDDPLCGFRVYPVESILTFDEKSDRMDFDLAIAVRFAQAGGAIVNVPVRVRYFAGGVSHFRMILDNVAISAAHSRLALARIFRRPPGGK